MAKKDEARDDDRQRQLDLVSRGESIEGGWCLDFDHPEVVYRCSDEEEAVARGDISVSFDRSRVLDIASGEVTERDADWSRFQPQFADVAGAPVASSPTGGGSRGPATGNGGGGTAT